MKFSLKLQSGKESFAFSFDTALKAANKPTKKTTKTANKPRKAKSQAKPA